MLAFLIYLMGIVDGIKCALDVATGSAMVALIVYCIFGFNWATEGDTRLEDAARRKIVIRKIKKYIWLPITFILINVFTPSATTLAAMYLIPKMAENQQLQQIPDKALTMLNLQLDKWVSNLTETDKGKSE